MKYVSILGSFLALILGLHSCKKDLNAPSPDMQRLWECHSAQHYDSTKLAKKLIGTWQWTKTTSELATKYSDKNVFVTFTPAGTFTEAENSTIIVQGNWQLTKVDGELLGLSLDTASHYLHGRILLCGNDLLFNSSYLDGSDNYFVRTK